MMFVGASPLLFLMKVSTDTERGPRGELSQTAKTSHLQITLDNIYDNYYFA